MEKKRKFFEEYFKFGFTSIVAKTQWSHSVFCATLFSVLILGL